MSEPNTLPPDIHPTIALLPWYVNGTLSVADRAAVSAHLQDCPSCRMELDELVRVGHQIKHSASEGPIPSATLAQSVLARVRQETQRRQAQVRRATSIMTETGSIIAHMDSWLRNLFVPQWVPTLVATLLVAQMGILLWTVSQQTPSRDGRETITSRGIGSPTARFRIEFQPAASAQQIQTLLSNMHGQVVDGPTTEGAYIMVIPAADPAAVEQRLQALRNRPEVIRHVETLRP